MDGNAHVVMGMVLHGSLLGVKGGVVVGMIDIVAGP
jgi:hypothetical protein